MIGVDLREPVVVEGELAAGAAVVVQEVGDLVGPLDHHRVRAGHRGDGEGGDVITGGGDHRAQAAREAVGAGHGEGPRAQGVVGHGRAVGLHQAVDGHLVAVGLGEGHRRVDHQQLLALRGRGVQLGPVGPAVVGGEVGQRDRGVLVQRRPDVGARGDAADLEVDLGDEGEDGRRRREAVGPVLVGDVHGHAVHVLGRAVGRDGQAQTGLGRRVGHGEAVVGPGQQAVVRVEVVTGAVAADGRRRVRPRRRPPNRRRRCRRPQRSRAARPARGR